MAYNKNPVVKITRADDGEPIKFAKWCYAEPNPQGQMALCTAQFYGFGESGCEYKEKIGTITCPDCIALIKRYQKIKL